jgi:hypothetical protein
MLTSRVFGIIRPSALAVFTRDVRGIVKSGDRPPAKSVQLQFRPCYTIQIRRPDKVVCLSAIVRSSELDPNYEL